MLALCALGLTGYSVVRIRAAGTVDRVANIALSIAAVLFLVRFAFAPLEFIPGLLVAWPILVLGAASTDRLRREEGAILVFAGLIMSAILAVQYGQGGGLEWGGRFFAPVLIPIAVLLSARVPVSRRAAGAVALCAIPGLMGLASAAAKVDHHEEIVDRVVASDPDVVLTNNSALRQLAWSRDEIVWLTVTVDDVDFVLDQLPSGSRVSLVDYPDETIAEYASAVGLVDGADDVPGALAFADLELTWLPLDPG